MKNEKNVNRSKKTIINYIIGYLHYKYILYITYNVYEQIRRVNNINIEHLGKMKNKIVQYNKMYRIFY